MDHVQAAPRRLRPSGHRRVPSVLSCSGEETPYESDPDDFRLYLVSYRLFPYLIVTELPTLFLSSAYSRKIIRGTVRGPSLRRCRRTRQSTARGGRSAASEYDADDSSPNSDALSVQPTGQRTSVDFLRTLDLSQFR